MENIFYIFLNNNRTPSFIVKQSRSMRYWMKAVFHCILLTFSN